MKIEFGSQRRQMLLFSTTKMAVVTSSADQQYWQLAISRNWQIEKMGDWARIHQRFGKNSNEVTKRGNLTKIHKSLVKMWAGWQKRHVDNCGFYENDIFCEIGEFCKGFITCKGPAKNLNEPTKEAYWRLAIFAKMANLRKRGIGKESIKGLAKLQLKWQRGESWRMAIIMRKWQI